MSKEDFIEAVKCGNVALVRELKNTIKDYQTRALAVEEACENGHLNVLHALQDYPLSPMCLFFAANRGHMNCVVWLLNIKCPKTAYACAGAAAGGHVDILKFLVENGCPVDWGYAYRKAKERRQYHVCDFIKSKQGFFYFSAIFSNKKDSSIQKSYSKSVSTNSTL
jgi:ankyrin repeat protein